MPVTLSFLQALTELRMDKRAVSIFPTALQNVLPTCAQQCIATNIEQTFPSSNCSNSTGLGCLCSHYNADGMTLGEVSLVCLNSSCQKSAINETVSTDAYFVCSTQPGAVVGTHTVLTSFATATAASGTSQVMPTTTMPTSTYTPSSLSTSSITSTSNIPTFATSTTSSAASTSTIMPSVMKSTIQATTTISLATSSSSMTAATSPTSHQSSILTSGQVAGISIGALAGLGALIALIFCCCCCVRRRKDKKDIEKKSHDSFDFVDKSPGPTSAFPSHLYMVPGQQPTAKELQKSDSRKQDNRAEAWSSFKATITIPSAPVSKQAPPYRPITQWPVPKSGATVSNKGIRCKPPRPPRPDSSATALTVFDEDQTPRFPHFPNGISSPPRAYDPRQSRPKLRPSYADEYTLSPEDIYHPSLSLEIPPMPHGGTHEHRLPSPTDLTPNSPSHAQSRSVDMNVPPTSAVSYLPAYYTSNDSRTPIVPVRSPRLSLPYPIPLLPRTTPKNGHMSYASVTTFESVDPDEITPPEELDKRLSAVAESPVSCVRYPKVPRPSNQAIPRSPPQSRWTASTVAFSPTSPETKNASPGPYKAFSYHEEKPLTLLTKRRGENAQVDLQQRLHIKNSSMGVIGGGGRRSSLYSQPSGATGGLRVEETGSPSKGRRGESERKGYLETLEMGLKSPLWEPELTPSKRGDDLFISVH